MDYLYDLEMQGCGQYFLLKNKINQFAKFDSREPEKEVRLTLKGFYMRNFLSVGALFFYSSIAISATNVHVQDFNFTYKDPNGIGQAKVFSRAFVSPAAALEVNVDKIDKDFKISVSGAESEEFEFKDAPSFMTEAETMNISGLNLKLETELNLTLQSAKFYSKASSMALENLSLSCMRDSSSAEEMDQLINGCIKKMNLTSGKFSSALIEESMVEVLGGVGVSSLDFNIANGKYDLQGHVKAQVSGKVKSTGQASYDGQTGVLTLKINEVKFGILNVTGKVFDELRKNESDKLKVKQPYLYISLK